MPSMYISYVYFYPSNPKIPNSQKSKQLKESLSDALSRFYPLAGRLIGNSYIDCKDGGAPFADAEAESDLSEAISSPNPNDMEKFLPYKADKHQDFCLAVQTTHFLYGGLAVGVLLCHKVFDAFSFISFVNDWFSLIRNGERGNAASPPMLDAADYFPPLDVIRSDTPAAAEEEVGAGKLFRFPASTIPALRETYTAGGHRPSPVQVLSAFIWTGFMSPGLTSDPDKTHIVRCSVNLRPRADPPLSGDHLGNIVGHAVVRTAAGDGGVEFARRFREALKGVDGGHVARMMNSEKCLEEMMAQANEGVQVVFDVSSICGYPLYEADFGWGRPVWVGVGLIPHKRLVFLLDVESGGGIQAFIYLPKQLMDTLETHLKM